MCARGGGYDTYTSYQTYRSTPTPYGTSVRVAKGLGSKGYGKLRLSVVYAGGINSMIQEFPDDVEWTYDAPFKYRWTEHHLRSAVVDVTPGVPQDFRCSITHANGLLIRGSFPFAISCCTLLHEWFSTYSVACLLTAQS